MGQVKVRIRAVQSRSSALLNRFLLLLVLLLLLPLLSLSLALVIVVIVNSACVLAHEVMMRRNHSA